jgi:ADP-ribosylglycohydrolase
MTQRERFRGCLLGLAAGDAVGTTVEFRPRGTFADAVLMAANLGDDADTTAAVCGQVAGAYYGEPGIPSHWLERLALRAEIARLADRLGGVVNVHQDL